FQSGRASSQKYRKAWNLILNFVLWRLIPPNQTPNTISNFSFQESECSYDSWIKTIAKLGLSFLTPSTTEPWFHSEIIDFQLLSSFGAKSSNNPRNEIIPVNKKTDHPESTLVRFLYQLQTPSRSSIQVWARIVAASIETVADK
ncbi:hypothetical protein BY996DRAFT_4532302, partial [Phakopsora pachyrhizi]